MRGSGYHLAPAWECRSRSNRRAELVKRLDRHPCLILNGGAILDFLADRLSRAHLKASDAFAWNGSSGCFWSLRRLWRADIVGGVIFSTRIVQVAWVSRSNATWSKAQAAHQMIANE